jgi:GT2 family glycosyltransferase
VVREAGRLRRCLAALAGGAAGIEHEVVLVLGGADDDVVAAARALRGERLKVVESPVNLGFAGACNLGAERAEGAFVALVHDDTIVTDGWLATLLRAFDRRPETGLIGSGVLTPAGETSYAGCLLLRDGTPLLLGRGEPFDAPLWREDHAVDFCSSSALLVRTAAWHAVGGMDDELFPAGYGDADLAMRVERAGWDVRCEPAARVVHDGGGSLPAGYKAWLHARNRERFVRTWAVELREHEEPGDGGAELIELGLRRAAARSERVRAAGPPASPGRAVLQRPAGTDDIDRFLRFARLELALQRDYIGEQDELLRAAREETSRVSERLHGELRRAHTDAAREIALRDADRARAHERLVVLEAELQRRIDRPYSN